MERLKNRLLESEYKISCEFEKAKGEHCIKIKFYRNASPTIKEEIRYDIENGVYPGLEIKPIYDRENVFNFMVCLEECSNQRQHCYLDEQKPYED